MSSKNTSAGLLGLHTVTSMHPGAGAALGLVDLPIQRERHTHWPNISGSAMKGILRDRCRENIASNSDDGGGTMDVTANADVLAEFKPGSRAYADATKKLTTLFGPPTTWASEFAGALSVTDARLIAFPVRSLRGVFAWVTCDAAIQRLKRDAAMAGLSVPDISFALSSKDKEFCAGDSCQCVHDDRYAVLEEFDFVLVEDSTERSKVEQLAQWLGNNLADADVDQLQKQLVVLSDDDFTHFARYATEIVARIKLDYETKTVSEGALFYQEFLPPESLLYSVVIANRARAAKNKSEGKKLLSDLTDLLVGDHGRTTLQIGGDETTGKGLCSVRLQRESEVSA